MTTVPNPTPPAASAPAPAAPDRAAWVLPVTVIGAVVTLMACAFGAVLVHMYPVLKEPLAMAVAIAMLAGTLITTVVLLYRRR